MPMGRAATRVEANAAAAPSASGRTRERGGRAGRGRVAAGAGGRPRWAGRVSRCDAVAAVRMAAATRHPFSAVAPASTGSATSHDSRDAEARSKPRARAAASVAPLRETPGISAAACARPSASPSANPSSTSSRRAGARSASTSASPPVSSPAASVAGVPSRSSIARSKAKPMSGRRRRTRRRAATGRDASRPRARAAAPPPCPRAAPPPAPCAARRPPSPAATSRPHVPRGRDRHELDRPVQQPERERLDAQCDASAAGSPVASRRRCRRRGCGDSARRARRAPTTIDAATA